MNDRVSDASIAALLELINFVTLSTYGQQRIGSEHNE